MSKCSDFWDLVKCAFGIIGAVLLFLLTIVAVPALFGLFIVLMSFPVDLYKSHFVEENSG